MKNRDWKDIAEIAGIGAIVASLVFVGLQMRQSHEIALVTLYQMRADAAREVMVASMESDILRQAYERMESEDEEPTFADEHALYSYMSILLNHFENAHFLYLRGFLTEEHWQSDVANITGTISEPGATEMWHDVKGGYRESFVEAIDSALEEMQ